MMFILADVSYMSIFNDFDETVSYRKDMFYGKIVDDFSMKTIDSITADNHESTLGSGTNDWENDAEAYTNLYSGQVEGAFGMFSSSLVVLIVIMNPVLRMNYFQIETLKRVFIMKLIPSLKLRKRVWKVSGFMYH